MVFLAATRLGLSGTQFDPQVVDCLLSLHASAFRLAAAAG